MRYCGALNIDKPTGLTSREIVDRVVKLVRPAKAGHAGTLDPLATGVLVVCVGHATRLISLVQEGRKKYLARFVLGQRSDTDDITGVVTAGGDWSSVTREELATVLAEFVGAIAQVPPQFSAIHVQGQRAYDLARRGETVELAARPVDVFSLRLTQFQPPDFEVEIECGSGTYVRSIGRDVGSRLGCGAVMTSLRRLAVGPFNVGKAVSPEMVTANSIASLLTSPLSIVAHFRQQRLTPAEVVAARCGQSIAANFGLDAAVVESSSGDLQFADPRTALVGPDGQLLGIAEFDPAKQRLNPRVVFPEDNS